MIDRRATIVGDRMTDERLASLEHMGTLLEGNALGRTVGELTREVRRLKRGETLLFELDGWASTRKGMRYVTSDLGKRVKAWLFD